ncbi:hypothetical protein HPG69_017438 [Diceros bicornis minor]|uniref:Scaffolding anchor of CK1 domain-containing protein n=1 Tax=Diceros bicornis minor TaxID=77932 RepID=A0A7J7EQ17_DICBM|nr:hypothetical protein HPG69_017438 [Diceros bicornis minor]
MQLASKRISRRSGKSPEELKEVESECRVVNEEFSRQAIVDHWTDGGYPQYDHYSVTPWITESLGINQQEIVGVIEGLLRAESKFSLAGALHRGPCSRVPAAATLQPSWLMTVRYRPESSGATVMNQSRTRTSVPVEEVIAVVMDVFTDIDIFRDLQEICRKQGVAVYILLDQALLSQFLDMCMDLKVHPEQEKLMTVRTITGNIYYARSGTKIVGKVHEKFTLIDGIRVATGSYSFTWTDGKLNSSNLVILSGQVVEHFDLEFRILYAQSKPISSKLLSNFRISGRFDHLVDRKPLSKELTLGNLLRLRLARLSSTPKKAELECEAPAEGRAEARHHDSESSTISEEDYFSSRKDEPEGGKVTDAATQTEPGEEMPAVSVSDAGTQTSTNTTCAGTQTTVTTRVASSQTMVRSTSATTQTDVDEYVLFSQGTQSKEGSPVSKMSVSRSSSLKSSSSLSSQGSMASSIGSQTSIGATDFVPPGHPKYWAAPYLDLCLRDSFRNLNQERQFHLAGIRSRLNHMLAMLSRRTFLTENYLGFHSGTFARASVDLLAVRDIALYPSYQ